MGLSRTRVTVRLSIQTYRRKDANMEHTVITSRQNPRIKSVCALSDKKEREQSGLFRFDGIKLLEEADRKGVEIVGIYVRESAFGSLRVRLDDVLVRHEACVTLVSDSACEKLTEEKAPEGVVTVARQMQALHPKWDAECEAWTGETKGCICLLEAIRDPGNLGTVIRTAAAMGIGTLILSSDCADLYHPRTVRAAMGALFTQRIIRVEKGTLPCVIGGLRCAGRRVFATALHQDALRLGEVALRQSDCVVIGNEGHGLTEETVAACEACMIIPMQEGSESLNAATAAAICMWELSRTSIGGAYENR